MRTCRSALLVCLPVVALGACREALVPDDPDPIVLAATYSQTGRFAALGNEVADGYRLAVEMLNEMGGVAGREVRLVLRDDGSDVQTSAAIYAEYVAADTIDALLGPYSSPITEAVVGLVETAGVPLVAPMAAAPGIWEGRGREWSVQMLNAAPTYLQGSVELAAQHGARTAALVYEDSPFPVSVAEGVREAVRVHGMNLVLDLPYTVNGADHEALAAAARDAGADLFIGGGYYDDAIEFTRSIPAVDYTPLLVSLNLGPAETGFAEELGDLARCVAGNAAWIPTIRTSGFITDSETLVSRYETTHGALPSYYVAGGFGAVELMAEAMAATTAEGGDIDPAAVRDFLFSMATETVLGPFDAYSLGDGQAGAQRALKGLQVQWQDDGAGGLTQRIVHPEAVADAEPCFRG